MAQSTFHFGFGMLCATACTIKPILIAWRSTDKHKKNTPHMAAPNVTPVLSSAIARWCLLSYAMGTWAVIPAVARRLTGVEPTHFLWNLFFLYTLIDRLPLPSIIIGELLVGIILGAQYGSILLAIYILRRKQ